MHPILIFYLASISYIQVYNAQLVDLWLYDAAIAARLKVTPSFCLQYLLLGLEVLRPFLLYHADARSKYIFQEFSLLRFVELQYAHLSLFLFGHKIKLLFFACLFQTKLLLCSCYFILLFFNWADNVINLTAFACLLLFSSFAITIDSVGIFI